MSPAPIIIALTLLGTAPEDSSLPQIAVVQTWDDLVQVEPQTLTKEVRVRMGISAEDPRHRLLIRYWRGQELDLSKTEFLRAEEFLRISDHEYTIHVTPASGVTAGTTIGVQLLYCELGWRPADPNSHADAISDHTNPVFPVVSNRVDVTVEEGGR